MRDPARRWEVVDPTSVEGEYRSEATLRDSDRIQGSATRTTSHGSTATTLDFRVDVSDAGETVHLAVRGEIDLGTAESLTAAVAAHIDRGCRQLHLDMSGVGFCGAAGLEVLLNADRALRAVGGALSVTGCSPMLSRCLRVTGLDAELRIV